MELTTVVVSSVSIMISSWAIYRSQKTLREIAVDERLRRRVDEK